MDTLPVDSTGKEDVKDTKDDKDIKVATEPRKLMRRKRDLDKQDLHVIVGTSAGRPKIPKAETKKLRKKLLEFEQQNQNLAQAISDKNQEISALKRSVDSLNEVLNSVPIDELRCNSSIAGSKILELSKKNRQMRAELEQCKNRINKKDVTIEKLEKELKANEEKLAINGELLKKGNATEELHAKINSMQQKLFETRNKNTELQNQLKLAQKCLQHEVGESVNINLLANNLNNATWRGRAQQIISLQQKLQELKARLDNFENGADRVDYMPITLGSEGDLASSSGTRVTPRNAKHSIHSPGRGSATASLGGGDAGVASFDRFTPGVRKSEILHRAKVEALEKQIVGLQAQLEEQRNRTLALKVRNKTLNDEMLKYKTRTAELEEQTDGNGLNASTLNDKLKSQRVQYETRLDDMRNDAIRITEERDIARRQMDELSGMNLELETELKQKTHCIAGLEEMIKKLETDLRAVTGGFLFSCREFRKEEFVGILDALEVEKNQMMLMKKTLEDRLDAERVKLDAANDLIGKQKTRIARLEVKVRDLEKELDVQNDRKKRSQRINEYTNALGRTPLTGSISSFSFDNQSQLSSVNSLTSLTAAEPKIEDMKNQLELANEKITMLSEKLDYLTAEKRADAKFFEETMNNSKNIILDTIRGSRDSSDSKVGETLPELVTASSDGV
ncbi:coiled-coil domain-containing protein 13 [Drosophila sulfurigaster albostrigata]|uniref:coiled-coil domain-containing protein 13 n=1 Tax=Drosophila sulfurigaster albostrigata TaxID=89887 RepID=UPI002D21C04D|nr:coiled-coil domain-containing protein 13 [Drosophila sulfurigaster albostrigata]